LKRSTALNLIKCAGYDGDTKEAALVTALNGIGKAASRKAYLDGQKMKEHNEPRPVEPKGK
jgi:hypothetical protein